MFNPLINQFPDVIGGAKINTDFRLPLRFFKLQKSRSAEDAALWALSYIFLEPPAVLEDMPEILIYYLTMGQDSEEEHRKVVCFDEDSKLIYGAFRQIYGIDLNRENLHWWEFLILFEGLPGGTVLSDIIGIRTKEIPTKGDRKYINELRRLKEKYRLDSEDDGAEKAFNALWGG